MAAANPAPGELIDRASYSVAIIVAMVLTAASTLVLFALPRSDRARPPR